MALPTLDRYRQANPNDTRSDEDVLWFLSGELAAQGTIDKYPDIAEYAQTQQAAFNKANPPSVPSELGRGLIRGTDTAQGQLYSTVAQAGAATGLQPVEDFGMRGWRRNQEEAAVNAPTVGSYSDVNNFSDALRYGLGVVGSNAPQMAGTIASAAVGTALGGPVGGALAAGLSGYTQTQNYADLVDSGGQDALSTALAIGAASSLLEAYVPIKLVSKFGLGSATARAGTTAVREGLETVLSKVPGLASRVIAEAGKDGFEEMTTELAQELVSIYGENYSNRNNPNAQVTPQQITDRLINAGLGGLILGGTAGGLTGLKPHNAAPLPVTDSGLATPTPVVQETPAPEPLPPTQTPVTPEAKDLINSVDTGGVPTVVTRNLERIAAENEIAVTPTTTPLEIVEELRKKDLAPTEVSEAVTPIKPVNISAYEPAFDPFRGMVEAFSDEGISTPVDQYLQNREKPLEVMPPEAQLALPAPTRDADAQALVRAVLEEESGEDLSDANVAVAPYVQTNEFADAAPKIYSVPSTGTLGERVVPIMDGLGKNSSRANTQRMVVLYDRKSGMTKAFGLYHGAKDALVTTGAKGQTKADIAKAIGMNYSTFRQYTDNPKLTSAEALRAREAWTAARKSTPDLALRHVLDTTMDDGQPRFIALARIDLSKVWDGQNVVFPSPEAFYERYRAESLAGAKTEAASFVPLMEHDDSIENDASLDDEGRPAIPEIAEQQQAIQTLSEEASATPRTEEVPLVALANKGLDEAKAAEVSLSDKEQQGLLMYLRNKAPDLLEVDDVLPPRDKDGLWQEEKAGLKRALELVLKTYRKVDVPVSEDFVYKLYKDIRGFTDSQRAEYSKPGSFGFRASAADAVTRYNRMVRGLAGLGVDVQLVEQAPQSAIEFIRNQWGVTVTNEQGQRLVALSLGDVTAPTTDNLRVLMHEVAHLATSNLPKWQQVLVADAIERLDGLKGKVFSTTLDARIRNKTLPNTQLMREVLAEHLAEKGIEKTEARNIAERFFDFFVKLVAEAAMLYGKLRGEVFLPSLVARYAEIRFREYVEGVVQSTNDIDTLHGTNRWNQGKQVSIFRPLNEGATVEEYDPRTGKITAQRVIDDSTLATAFNFETILADEDTEFSQSDGPAPAWQNPTRENIGFGKEGQLLSQLGNVLSGAGGAMQPGADGKISTEGVKKWLTKRVDSALAAWYEQNLKLPARATAAEIKAAVQEATPQVEVKALAPKGASEQEKAKAKATHRLESLGLDEHTSSLSGDSYFYDKANKLGYTHSDWLGERNPKFTAHPNPEIQALIELAVSTPVVTTDAATGRYGVEPIKVEEMTNPVDLLIRVPEKFPSADDIRSKGYNTATAPLFRGPHFGVSDVNVVASIRGYEVDDAFFAFEVQSDWGQSQARSKKEFDEKIAPTVRFVGNTKEGPHYEIKAGSEWRSFYGSKAEVLRRAFASWHGNSEVHPLAERYQAVGIRAAIVHALESGKTKLVLPDANTAMMIEGHDARAEVLRSEENERRAEAMLKSNDLSKFNDPRMAKSVLEEVAMGNSVYNFDLTPAELVQFRAAGFKVGLSQEAGMRQAYDRTYQDIARKLTGDRGRRVNLGEFTARDPSKYFDGKKTITGYEYDLSSLLPKPQVERKSDLAVSAPLGSGSQGELNRSYKSLGLSRRDISGKEFLAKISAHQEAAQGPYRELSNALATSPLIRSALVRVARNMDDLQRLKSAEGEVSTAAIYQIGEHTIVFSPSADANAMVDESTIIQVGLHELIHAGTARAISFYEDYAKNPQGAINVYFDGDKAQATEVYEATRQLDKVFKWVKSQKALSDEYGMTSLDEFAAELANPLFVAKLSTIVLPASLKSDRVNTMFHSVLRWFETLFNLSHTNSASEAAVSALGDLIQSTTNTSGLRQNINPRDLASPTKTREELNSDEKVRFDIEQEFAHVNSVIDQYEALFDEKAKAMQIGVRQYLVDVLGMRDIYASRETLETRIGMLSRPIKVNDTLRLNPKTEGQDVVNPVVRNKLLDRVYINLQKAFNRMVAKTQKDGEGISRAEKEIEKTQAQFVRIEEYLFNTIEQNGDANASIRESLTELKQQLRSASGFATKNSNYAAVLGKLLGNEDADVSKIYVDALERLSEDGASNFMLVDALTAASQLNIDWENDSVVNISQQIVQSAKGPLRTALSPLLEQDALGKALMAAVVYYGKEKPERMASFSIKVAKAGQEKTAAIGALKEIINGASRTVEQLEDDIREARSDATLVGKVKLQFRQKQLELIRKKRSLALLRNSIAARNEAAGTLSGTLSKMRVEKGIRQPFEYRDGVKIFLTPKPGMSASEVLGSFKVLDNSTVGWTTDMMRDLMDNVAWLDANRGLKDDVYFQVEDQVAKGTALFQNETEYKVHRARGTAFFQPTYNKIVASGLASARRLGVPIRDFIAKQLQARSMAFKGREVVKALRDFQRITDLDYDTSISLFYNSAMRFVETNNQVIAEARTRAEGEALMKDRLRAFFLENPVTKPLIQKPGAFEAFYRFYQRNAEANRIVVNFAKENNVYVEDSRVQVMDPRSGTLRPVYRPALDIGLDTGSRSTRRVGEIVLLLQKVLGPEGSQPWMKALGSKDATGEKLGGVDSLTPDDIVSMFTPEVCQLFVAPFATDTGRSHFSAPRIHPDAPRFRAQPVYVRAAWDAAKGDMPAFLAALYELETNNKLEGATEEVAENFKQFQVETLKMLVGKFHQMSALANAADSANKLGLQHVPHHVMDARLADDLPSEFVEYMVYDETTLEKTLEQVAGHSAFGRNLGLDTRPDDPNSGWFHQAEEVLKEMRRDLRDIDLAYSLVKAEQPLLDRKTLDRLVEKRIGTPAFERGERLRKSILDLEDGMREVRGMFTSPGGASRDIGLAQEIVGTIAGLTVQSPKSAIQQISVLFEPFLKLRMSKAAAKLVGSGLYESSRSVGMTLFNAMGSEFIKADKYDRLMSETAIIRDSANALGVREIWADTGMGNSFESNKVKGFIRRGRTALFHVGIRARNPEARLTPALRVFAPFSSAANHINYGSVKSHLIAADNWIQEGIRFLSAGRLQSDAKDPNFKFKYTDLPSFSGPEGKTAFAEMQERFMKWGTSFEWEVRRALAERANGNDVQTNLTPDLIRKVSALALEESSIESSATTLPSFFKDNAMGRLSAPLVTWPVAKMNALLGDFNNAKGEAEWGATRAAFAALLFGMVPIGIILSLLMDEYDDEILRKQSNLADFTFDTDNPHFAAQNANAFVERLTRTGTFGLAGDVVNGIKTYGSDGDLRGLSFDKRVLFSNTILTVMGAASNAWHQNGTLTYQTFWRPLASALGGAAAIQNIQILNGVSDDLMGVPLFGEEARVTARINANNYLRSAGRVAGMEVRTGSGSTYISTPVTPWVGQMVLAAYGNDRLSFAEAYRGAVNAARDSGHEDAEDYVKQSFAGRHPLRSVFRTAITDAEYHRLLGILNDAGRRDVTQAVSYFNSYGASIGAKPFAGKKESSKPKGRNTLPSAY